MALGQVQAARAGRAAWPGLSLSRYSLPPSLCSIVPRTASIRLAWPPTMFAQVGELASSKSAMKPRAPGVERVDHHLAVGRAGDLDAPVLQGRRARARPSSRPRARVIGPSVPPASSSAWRSARGGEQLAPRAVELVVEPLQEPERLRGQDLGRTAAWAHARDARCPGLRNGRSARCDRASSSTGAPPRGRARAPRSAARSRGWRRPRPRRRWPAGSRALRSAQLGRRLGLDQVVDPGRAAADLPLGRLDQLELGDRAQQLARLLPHALGVGEVAGVVVGDPQRQRACARRAARRRPRSSVTSRTRPANAAARSAHSGSSRSRCP